ncbi:sucrase ferredoxin [Amycolatopsis sp. NPDC049159]|uniref:sucrase ferredoxin n=1 Tax=Amycolatopsis sp. NPDC049159 TaxID=3157210 RepID=UPI00340304AB
MTRAPLTGPPRCADLADADGDAREGTAPPADRWLLIEHAGPWERNALAVFDADVLAALTRWAGRTRGRIVLIRRPGRRTPRGDDPRRWFRVDARPGHEEIRTGEYRGDADLAAVGDLTGHRSARPLTLVCAHGKHDTCCAVRGRPLAAALAAADPEGTWECSHIGGCRFAPAVVLLPHGFTFGGVGPAEAVSLVRGYARGTLAPDTLRGRSSVPPVVQAAQHHARKATGATGVDDLNPVAYASEDDGVWRVTLTRPECTVLLRERLVTVDRPLTCAARPPGHIRVFDAVEVLTAGGRALR